MIMTEFNKAESFMNELYKRGKILFDMHKKLETKKEHLGFVCDTIFKGLTNKKTLLFKQGGKQFFSNPLGFTIHDNTFNLNAKSVNLSGAHYLNNLYIIGKYLEKDEVINKIKTSKWLILKQFFEKSALLLIDGYFQRQFVNEEGVRIVVKISKKEYFRRYAYSIDVLSSYSNYTDCNILEDFDEFFSKSYKSFRFLQMNIIAIIETIKDDFIRFIDDFIVFEKENIEKVGDFIEDINKKFASHLAIKELQK